MHNPYPNNLCNDNEQKYAAQLLKIRLNKCIAQVKKTPHSALSKADIFKETEKCTEINLTRLAKEKRGPVWDWIKQNRPGLSILLSKDQDFNEIKTAFDASVKVQIPETAARELGLIR